MQENQQPIQEEHPVSHAEGRAVEGNPEFWPDQERELPANKHDAARVLVAEAKEVVAETERQMQECRLLLSSDLEGFEEAKRALQDQALLHSEALLKNFHSEAEKRAVTEVVFEPEEEIEAPVIQEVYSGRFSGFLVALFAGMVTLLGFIYWAAHEKEITLSIESMPDVSLLTTLVAWYGNPLQGSENFTFGMILVVVSVTVVMALVYWVRVKIKANMNLQFAMVQLDEARFYSRERGDCRSTMEQVDAHIKEVIETLKMYRIFLSEQNAKLERIAYIEGNESFQALHPKSKVEIDDTRSMVESVCLLLHTPMSEEGKLSMQSKLVLQKAQKRAEELIERLY